MKKVLSLVLASMLVLGMSTMAFAAAPVIGDGQMTVVPVGSSTAGSDFDISGTVEAGTEIKALLPAEYFGLASTSDLTVSMLTREKITVKKKITKGTSLVKDVTLENTDWVVSAPGVTPVVKQKGVVVQIEFIDPFVSTKTEDFDITVYLALKGTKQNNTEISFTGEFGNPVIEVDEDDEVNLSEGAVAKAISYTKNIKVDAGNGLFIQTKMFEDKKYYAQAIQEITSADDEIIAKYPEIDTIYTLHTVNMNSAGNEVTFDIDDTYYVYNAEGKYVGTTKDKLGMSKKYYLATKKIDMAGDVDATETDGSEAPTDVAPSIDSPATGGDDVPANANDNPGTGANGFVNVAVAAGLVALAAAGVSMKK